MATENNQKMAFATQQIPVLKCTTCLKHPASPYRRITNGKILEGCVDKCHDDYVTSSVWRR